MGIFHLLSDVKIPTGVGGCCFATNGVLVAPPVNFGSSPYFLTYPGTFSLRLSTLMDAVEDIVRSAYGQGFKRILFLNGHGGNTGLKSPSNRTCQYPAGILITVVCLVDGSQRGRSVACSHELKPSHANWLEAFPFTIVTDLAGGEKDSTACPFRYPGCTRSPQMSMVTDRLGACIRCLEEIDAGDLRRCSCKTYLQLLKFE